MNALQLVNSVLRRLRIEEVTDFSEAYTKLILDFINETKREVEDSYNWASLQTNIPITTTTVDRDYSLTGAGQRYRILSANNETDLTHLSPTSRMRIKEQQQIGNTTPCSPYEYAITGQDASLDPIISFGPYPDGVYTLNFNVIVPQAELSAIADTMKVPWYPVVLGTWAKAISERGEDGGQNTIEQHGMYVNALSDAIAQEDGRLMETIWQQV